MYKYFVLYFSSIYLQRKRVSIFPELVNEPKTMISHEKSEVTDLYRTRLLRNSYSELCDVNNDVCIIISQDFLPKLKNKHLKMR